MENTQFELVSERIPRKPVQQSLGIVPQFRDGARRVVEVDPEELQEWKARLVPGEQELPL